jgi:hypothetical protein
MPEDIELIDLHPSLKRARLSDVISETIYLILFD